MTDATTLLALPRPSADVRAEALARARALADGLFPHQVDGVAFLLSRRRAILADDMGLGKTRQSIVALTEAMPVGPWLVLSPASVKHNWAREIRLARPNDRVHVVGPEAPPPVGYDGWVVVNYDLLDRWMAELERHRWTGIVYDEAHYLKNHRSKRSRHARALAERASSAVLHLLTGTPLTNRPRDLFALLHLVRHPMATSFLSYATRYCAATHNGFGWNTDGASNLDELRLMLHGVMLRRTKDEVLDLPGKLRSWLAVDVPAGTARAETRAVVEELTVGALERAAKRDEQRAAPARRRGNGAQRPDPVAQDRVRLLSLITKARVQLSKAKVPATLDFVEGVVEQGEKAIVFTAFDEPARAIARKLGDQALLLTGSTPTATRQRLVDRFQSDPSVRVLVANIVAGGVGITLTAARQVVFHDLDWVPANHWQAEDRAYRIGQTQTVNVTYLVAAGTIDDFVRSVLEVKADLVQAVVEGGGDDAPGAAVFDALAAAVQALSPGLASLGDDESGEAAVDRLLREVVTAVASRRPEGHGVDPDGAAGDRAAPARTTDEAQLRALARALLSGAEVRRFKVQSRRDAWRWYRLTDDGGIVTCDCSGFQYRGACSHARGLKLALASGGELPPGVEEVTG